MWSDCLMDLGSDFSFVTWSLYEMRSILRKHLVSMACILLCSSAARVNDSQDGCHKGAYQSYDHRKKRIKKRKSMTREGRH